MLNASRENGNVDVIPRKCRSTLEHPPALAHTTMPKLPPIPSAFAAKKATILASLALPSSEYSDLSPKGTIDEAIIPLIEKINQLEGVVTTSSCAGRVSVFLEGKKIKGCLSHGKDVGAEQAIENSKSEQIGVSGGKGNGGRWLFISHEPVNVGQATAAGGSLLNVFGISGQNEQSCFIPGSSLGRLRMRHARFQFEPMVCSCSPML